MALNNVCLLSLAYKLIDKFSELTLFGGVVRDIICPAIYHGDDPFDSSFESKERIEDLDIYITWKWEDGFTNEEDMSSRREYLVSWVFDNLITSGKLREWDWTLQKYEKINIYHLVACRFFIRNQITGIETHIDFVGTENPKNIFLKDMDVNMFTFNKAEGLVFKKKHSKSIKGFFRHNKLQVITIKNILEKKCIAIFKNAYDPVNDDEKNMINLEIKRAMKMIRKGWVIINMDDGVNIMKDKSDSDCNICYRPIVGNYIYIMASKCTLCLDCFEKLLENELSTKTKFRCPLTRTEYLPWKFVDW